MRRKHDDYIDEFTWGGFSAGVVVCFCVGRMEAYRRTNSRLLPFDRSSFTTEEESDKLERKLENISMDIADIDLLEFISLKGNHDGKQETKIDSNGNYWYRTKGGSWYTFSPDEDASEPWY